MHCRFNSYFAGATLAVNLIVFELFNEQLVIVVNKNGEICQLR